MARGEYGPRTALVVVDVQNDFAHPDGNLYVEDGERIIGGINEEIAAAREAGGVVVYTQDWHPASTPHFAKDGGTWPVHCVADTWGAEFHADLEVDGPIVQKGTEGGDGYSGFSVRDPRSGDETATQLESILQEQAVERVHIVGLAQDVCVKATVLDARERGYETVLFSELTRPVDPEEGEQAFQQMDAAGAAIG